MFFNDFFFFMLSRHGRTAGFPTNKRSKYCISQFTNEKAFKDRIFVMKTILYTE